MHNFISGKMRYTDEIHVSCLTKKFYKINTYLKRNFILYFLYHKWLQICDNAVYRVCLHTLKPQAQWHAITQWNCFRKAKQIGVKIFPYGRISIHWVLVHLLEEFEILKSIWTQRSSNWKSDVVKITSSSEAHLSYWMVKYKRCVWMLVIV